ncbi:MAG: methyltransferase domain-containing protein [Planctomycetes bacterium]|nr:methyltransferase domain-containing protein [Planctomycetota bacterium]
MPFSTKRLLSLLLAFLAACTGTPHAPESAAPAAAPEAVAKEPSVKPGINDAFKNNVDVQRFVNQFETESREIYSRRRAVADAVGLRPGEHVADIGTGTGVFLPVFAKDVGPTGLVYGVDIAPEFLARLGKRLREWGIDNVRLILCKDDSVELPPASVDVVFICDTYHHFEYPRATLASIHRALRPGGRLVLVDFIRIEGVSRQWALDHVRAGQEVFSAEIEAAGFRRVDEVNGVLKENYIVRFRRVP